MRYFILSELEQPKKQQIIVLPTFWPDFTGILQGNMKIQLAKTGCLDLVGYGRCRDLDGCHLTCSNWQQCNQIEMLTIIGTKSENNMHKKCEQSTTTLMTVNVAQFQFYNSTQQPNPPFPKATKDLSHSN